MRHLSASYSILVEPVDRSKCMIYNILLCLEERNAQRKHPGWHKRKMGEP
jgi:hypothetical protein